MSDNEVPKYRNGFLPTEFYDFHHGFTGPACDASDSSTKSALQKYLSAGQPPERTSVAPSVDQDMSVARLLLHEYLHKMSACLTARKWQSKALQMMVTSYVCSASYQPQGALNAQKILNRSLAVVQPLRTTPVPLFRRCRLSAREDDTFEDDPPSIPTKIVRKRSLRRPQRKKKTKEMHREDDDFNESLARLLVVWTASSTADYQPESEA